MPYDYSDYARDSRCPANFDDMKCDGCNCNDDCDYSPCDCCGPYEEYWEDNDET